MGVCYADFERSRIWPAPERQAATLSSSGSVLSCSSKSELLSQLWSFIFCIDPSGKDWFEDGVDNLAVAVDGAQEKVVSSSDFRTT